MRTIQIEKERMEKALEDNLWLIAKGEQGLLEGTVAENRLGSVRMMVFTQLLHLSINRYSSGMSSSEGFESVQKAFQIIESCWDDHISVENDDYFFDWYVKMVWLLSLGNALNIPLEDFSCAVRAWDKSERKDWLVDYLIKGRIPERELSSNLIFPKPYATIKKAVETEDKEAAAKLLKNYLKKEWYPGHSATYWHKYHLSKRDVFFGYWSLETAVVAKLAGIDDTTFQDEEYYPKELYSW